MPEMKAHSSDPNKPNLDILKRIIELSEADVDPIWREIYLLNVNNDPKELDHDVQKVDIGEKNRGITALNAHIHVRNVHIGKGWR